MNDRLKNLKRKLNSLNITLWRYDKSTPIDKLLRHHKIARCIFYTCAFSAMGMFTAFAEFFILGLNTIVEIIMIVCSVVFMLLIIPALFCMSILDEIEKVLRSLWHRLPGNIPTEAQFPGWFIAMFFWIITGLLIHWTLEDELASHDLIPVAIFIAMTLIARRIRKKYVYKYKKNYYLKNYLDPQLNYVLYVGYPLDKPDHWIKVIDINENLLNLGLPGPVRVEDVRSYIATYPNGEILNLENIFYPFPDSVHALKSGEKSSAPVILNDDLIQKGKNLVKITYDYSQMDNQGEIYFSTILTNISNQEIRIEQFTTVCENNGHYYRNTAAVIDSSVQPFQNWKSITNLYWINPGQSVTDPHNYGGVQAHWAFFCQTEDADFFIAVAPEPIPPGPKT